MLGREPFLLMQCMTALPITVNEGDLVSLFTNFAYLIVEKTPEAQASERG